MLIFSLSQPLTLCGIQLLSVEKNTHNSHYERYTDNILMQVRIKEIQVQFCWIWYILKANAIYFTLKWLIGSANVKARDVNMNTLIDNLVYIRLTVHIQSNCLA